MNLKESFRYQKFLDRLKGEAIISIQTRGHYFKTTKKHLRNKVNPEAEDITEEVECESSFFPNDDVICFLEWLVGEREKLTIAIDNAKKSIDLDIDASIATNKFRQDISSGISVILRCTPSKRVEQGRDYKFNADGNQMPYYYDIEVTTEEAYDRTSAKKVMLDLVSTADRVSAEIEAAMINTVIDYEPVYDVNESFDDVMTKFIEIKNEVAE